MLGQLGGGAGRLTVDCPVMGSHGREGPEASESGLDVDDLKVGQLHSCARHGRQVAAQHGAGVHPDGRRDAVHDHAGGEPDGALAARHGSEVGEPGREELLEAGPALRQHGRLGHADAHLLCVRPHVGEL